MNKEDLINVFWNAFLAAAMLTSLYVFVSMGY